jgi:hypothetical protein
VSIKNSLSVGLHSGVRELGIRQFEIAVQPLTPQPSTPNPQLCNPNPTPHTPSSSPYTLPLHPTPHTPHPTPYTLPPTLTIRANVEFKILDLPCGRAQKALADKNVVGLQVGVSSTKKVFSARLAWS